MTTNGDRPRMSVILGPEIQELLEQKRTHDVRQLLSDLQVPELVDLLEDLPPEHRAVTFRLLPRDTAANVFTELPGDQQSQLLDELTDEQLAQMFNEMDPDDRAELFDEMPGQLAAQLLQMMRPEERRSTQVILGYPADSVGRIMTPEYISLKPEWTIEEAFDRIRRKGADAETVHVVYVIDDRGRLLDEIRIRELLLADPQANVESLMDESAVWLNARDDQEEAVRTMERYDLSVLPVVDRDHVLVGIVTFDDVADVAAEETTEDIHKAAGVAPITQPYMEASLYTMFKKRSGWLAILFLGQMLTATAMERFESQLEAVIVLAIFIPLIISSGGNSGSQATSLIIRAMAVGDVQLRDWWRVMRREIFVGLSLGLFLAVIGLFRVMGWQWLGFYDYGVDYVYIALTVSIALIGVVAWGSLVGSMLPFILRKVGFDPATSSAPFVATFVDVTGLLIYFYTAMLILQHAIEAG